MLNNLAELKSTPFRMACVRFVFLIIVFLKTEALKSASVNIEFVIVEFKNT